MAKWLKSGNHKLGSNIKIWSITAGYNICGRECVGCYAMKAQNGRFGKAVSKARELRYYFSKKPEFVETISKEIKQSRCEFVRVHESGEFYSQNYIDSWVKIAEENSDRKFYAYTKRLKHFDFSKLTTLDNFVVIDSFKFGGLNYGKLEDVVALAEKNNSFVCPDYATKEIICGVSCTYCMSKEAQANGVCFVKH